MTEERGFRASEDPAPEGEEQEPELKGTLVLTTLLLIMIFGFWALMYFNLIGR